jgi:hypothetical protein
VLRTAGETETTQENIQDWLQLDEGDSGFQILTEEEISAVIYTYVLFNFVTTACINAGIAQSVYRLATGRTTDG